VRTWPLGSCPVTVPTLNPANVPPNNRRTLRGSKLAFEGLERLEAVGAVGRPGAQIRHLDVASDRNEPIICPRAGEPRRVDAKAADKEVVAVAASHRVIAVAGIDDEAGVASHEELGRDGVGTAEPVNRDRVGSRIAGWSALFEPKST